MPGIGINHDFHFVSLLFQRLLELLYIVHRDATVLSAENAQY